MQEATKLLIAKVGLRGYQVMKEVNKEKLLS